MRARILFAVLILLAPAPAQGEFAERPQGPVRADSLYALDGGHLSFPPRSGKLLASSELQIRISGSLANTSIIRDQYRVDTESRSFAVSAAWGIGQDTDMEIELPLRWRGGGVLDPLIDGWHQAFGMPRGRRDRVGDNEYDVSGYLDDGSEFDFADQGSVLGNPRFGVQHALWQGDNGGATLHGEVSIPGQTSSQTHRGIDGLLGASIWRNWSDLTGYAGLAVGAIGDRDLYGVEYKPLFVEGYAALEYPVLRKLRLSVAFWVGSSKISNVQDHPESFGTLDVGAKLPGAGGVFEFLVRENPWPQEGSPDVAFTLGWSFQPRS